MFDPAPQRPFRIYREPQPGELATLPHDADALDTLAVPLRDPHLLASRELLRPPALRGDPRDLEPYSRNWFEELEIKRYAPNGVWLRRLLEFTRHAGESLLMVGPGVGTDAIQYQRHGVQVTICSTSADHPDLIRRNFDVRGLSVRIVYSPSESVLPFERGHFDLAYVNLLYSSPADFGSMTCELYRVLKPGGKIFVLAPAKYDLTLWQNVLLPYRRWYRESLRLSAAPRYSSYELRRLFGQFSEFRTSKRHLRRSELPHLWRFAPIGLLERAIGHILVMRAFKPIASALEPIPPNDSAA